ncbi:MAG: DUF2868 domain-containing protein [Nitrospiraceae bacterium]|nr:MAG: DUF2868 domain-containing protein [Nitrospiraceae bacterium]
MRDQELSRILLVRSVEEVDPGFFSAELRFRAVKESGDAGDETAFIRNRSEFLFHSLPDRIKAVPSSLHFSKLWIVSLVVLSFFLGVIINYLGPGEQIHVLYNPVIMLVLWNFLVFALVLSRYFIFPRKKDRVGSRQGKKLSVMTGQSDEGTHGPAFHLRRNFSFSSLPAAGPPLMRKMLMRRLKKQWTAVHQGISQKKRVHADNPSLPNISSRYLDLWWELHRGTVIARCAVIFHILAMALVLGALSGVYMRGLFSEYNIVWKSTFIKDPSQVQLLLNIFFAFPSMILDGSMIQQQDIDPLLSSGGAPAAIWIHIFALSSLLYVMVPRIIFMLFALRTGKRLSSLISINPNDPYYADCISYAREIQTSHLREEIESLVRTEISQMAEAVGVYARDNFYDRHVVPRLNDFRTHGGRISDLEHMIAEESTTFEPELELFLRERQSSFNISLASGVSKTVGRELSPALMSLDRDVRTLSGGIRQQYGAPVTRDMTTAINITVTTVIAASLGTISGGFGKALGVAVISTLLHTTGPVGFLIGALGGLLLGGSAALLGKEKITGMVQDRNFPGFVTKAVLSESKLEKSITEGRSQVYYSTKSEIEEKLSPYIDEITNRIVSEIRPVLHEQRSK